MTRNESSFGTGEAAALKVAASRYDDCLTADGFSNLIHGTRFSKQDRRVWENWLVATEGLVEADVNGR